MISIALYDKTVEISAFNLSDKVNNEETLYQLWATRKADNKNFLVKESTDESSVVELANFINRAIDNGEYLADTREV